MTCADNEGAEAFELHEIPRELKGSGSPSRLQIEYWTWVKTSKRYGTVTTPKPKTLADWWETIKVHLSDPYAHRRN